LLRKEATSVIITKVVPQKQRYGHINVPAAIMAESNVEPGDYVIWEKHDKEKKTYIVRFKKPEEMG
jgi:hypothetical protein